MGNINVACSYLLILYNYNHAYTLVSTQSFLHVSQFRVLSFFTSTSRQELYSRHFCFAAVPDPKGPSVIISSQLQYSTSLLVTWSNILVNMVFSEHTACCKSFCFRWHCMCRIVWQKEITWLFVTKPAKGTKLAHNTPYHKHEYLKFCV